MTRRRRRPKRKALPLSLSGLIKAGGPEGLARRAPKEAATRAANAERKLWLGVLEDTLPGNTDLSMLAAIHGSYIRDSRNATTNGSR
jgi:hypothetical protein